MQRTKLKFPMVIQWANESQPWVINQATDPERCRFARIGSEVDYDNNLTVQHVLRMINSKEVFVLAEPQSHTLKVEVDASQAIEKMEQATLVATRLTEALEDVKALLK